MAEKPKKTLARVRSELRRDRDAIARAQERIDANLPLAIELGGAAPDVAADAGITIGYLSRKVGGVRKARAAAGVPAPKRKTPARPKADEDQDQDVKADEGPADCDSASAPAATEGDARPSFTPGAVERVRQLVHAEGLVSDRWAKPRTERATVFVSVGTGEWWTAGGASGGMPWAEGSAAELLAGVPKGTARVYLVGPHRPGVTPDRVREFGDGAKAARAWFLAPVPGWTGSHYLADDSALVGRWTDAEGQTIEVQHAAVWFGHADYSARDAAVAWWVLRRELDAVCPGAVLMSTPSTTGRDMWRRMIPDRSKGWPVLSDELRDLIRYTSGQGRSELVRSEPLGVGLVSTYDMRMAYAALTWGMPVGAPKMVTSAMWSAMPDEDQHRLLGGRGRWFVRATVPAGWDHIGILPHLTAEGWVWPSTPGQTFRSWCSSSELALAREHGWRVDVMEGMNFREGKPLNDWRDACLKVHAAADEGQHGRAAGLVRAAVRMILLGTIGAFASRAREVTHSTANPDEIPGGVQVREVAGAYVWQTPGERSEWTERTSHPEWAAEIWGRCRTRLLEAPAVGGVRTGALHVPAGSVIGLSTDGLTLVGDPGWPDEGKVGQYRLVGRMRGAFEWPQTRRAWEQMKRMAAGALETGEMQ